MSFRISKRQPQCEITTISHAPPRLHQQPIRNTQHYSNQIFPPMDSSARSLLLSLLSILSLISASHQSLLRLPSDFEDLFCDSWRLSVETNNAGPWDRIASQCVDYVRSYMIGDRYLSDSEVVANDSFAFAESINVAGDGKDAWVFDIDETLLSNLPYYEQHGFGSDIFNESSFDEWVELAVAPALPASLKLYDELKDLGFTIILLTGRSEYQRNATVENLHFAGYSGWERLILRGAKDQKQPATLYKSQKREELIYEGYRIHGSSGDQWSDLLGFAEAERSFKLPNPMYYIP